MSQEQGGIVGLGHRSNLLGFIKQYLQTRTLLRGDFNSANSEKDLIYGTEEHFWQDIIQHTRIHETSRVLLEEFLLLEWIPMLPGQYHTEIGKLARTAAQEHIVERDSEGVIYDPYGKTKMLRGGKGCIRLEQKQVTGDSLRFLCATTSGVAHRGILVGVPEDLYVTIAQPLQLHGGTVCKIIGNIRRWSLRDELPIESGQHLDRLYIYVEHIDLIQTSPLRPDSSRVTAAITFRGTFKGMNGIYFTYGTFDPSDRENVARCARWLEQNYVQARYQGQVLTNFDEYAPHFENVRLPVTTVMDPTTASQTLINQSADAFQLNQEERKQIFNYFNVNIEGNAEGLVVGDNPRVNMRFDK